MSPTKHAFSRCFFWLEVEVWCITHCLRWINLSKTSKAWVKGTFFSPSSLVFSVDCSTVECPPVQQVVCPLDSYETQVRLTADGCCTLPTRFVSGWLSIFCKICKYYKNRTIFHTSEALEGTRRHTSEALQNRRSMR